MNRERHIDIAKGIGILTVLWGHSGIELFHYMIYMFHMPLFIFCSGYCHKERSVRDAIQRKGRALLPVYLIFLAICFVVDTALVRPATFGRAVDLIGKQSGGPLWFIPCLFLSYVSFMAITAVCKKIFPSDKRRRDICAGAACLALSATGYLCSRYDIKLWLYLDTTMSMIIFYYLGYMVKALGVRPKHNAAAAVTGAVMFVAVYVVSYKFMHLGCNDLFANVVTPVFAIYITGAAAGIAMVFYFSRLLAAHPVLSDSYISKILVFLGETSLYVFALHMSVFNIWHAYFAPSTLNALIMMGVALAICLTSRKALMKTMPGVFS